mmetsp:Transcript_40248/g.119301  ORF Transcript_40248/g.119301 Transcript_40248/m.119301 type:complete len:216 (+) Transcript_40248:416-1063(+)
MAKAEKADAVVGPHQDAGHEHVGVVEHARGDHQNPDKAREAELGPGRVGRHDQPYAVVLCPGSRVPGLMIPVLGIHRGVAAPRSARLDDVLGLPADRPAPEIVHVRVRQTQAHIQRHPVLAHVLCVQVNAGSHQQLRQVAVHARSFLCHLEAAGRVEEELRLRVVSRHRHRGVPGSPIVLQSCMGRVSAQPFALLGTRNPASLPVRLVRVLQEAL